MTNNSVHYSPETIRQFQGNPLIEALPPRSASLKSFVSFKIRAVPNTATKIENARLRTGECLSRL